MGGEERFACRDYPTFFATLESDPSLFLSSLWIHSIEEEGVGVGGWRRKEEVKANRCGQEAVNFPAKKIIKKPSLASIREEGERMDVLPSSLTTSVMCVGGQGIRPGRKNGGDLWENPPLGGGGAFFGGEGGSCIG